MFIYIICFLFLFLINRLIKKDKFNFYDFLLLFIFITVACVRYGVGTDYNMYKSFYFFPAQSAAEKVEFGFIELIKISNMLFDEKFYLFFGLCSLLTIFPIYYIFKKYSSNPIFSFILFVSLGFYTMSFNMVRQFIAISLVLFSLKFIKERNFFKYIICISFASVFHLTSLFILPLYFVLNINFDKKTLKIFFIISLFAGLVFNPIFNYIVNAIPQYSMYKTYTNVSAGIGTYLVDFIYLFIIYFLINYKDKMIKTDFDKICLNISIISVPLIALSVKNILFARMIYYFFIPALVPFSNILYFFKIKHTQKIFNIILVILLFAIYILNILYFNGVYPYVFIFNYL